MSRKKFLSLFILSTIITTNITTNSFSINSSAEEINRNEFSSKKLCKADSFGFLAYLYNDINFSNLESIKFNVSSDNLVNSENIKSAKFIAQIKAPETKYYHFSTTNNKNCILKINDEIIINKELNSTPIKLIKDQIYSIEMEVSGDLKNLQLFLLNSNLEKETIDKENILLPNPSKDSTQIIDLNPTNHNSSRILSKSSNTNNNQLKDSDKDGIPDEWEMNGYTYKDNEIIKWTDNLSSQVYPKYVSNPYKARTANDPYTDMQKVVGQMPAATSFEARDPMIAAVPVISVGMENLLMSKNQNVSTSSAGTKSVATGKSDTTSHELSINAGFQTIGKSLSFNLSPSYTNTSSTTTYVENTDSKSWSEELGLNKADSAYLNANIRYYNTGTAPVYMLRPTTNFVLENSKFTLTTIKSGPNQIGNSLAPGSTYPEKDLSPIALDVANELGTTNIAVDIDTLNDLQSGADAIKVETTQFTGQYGTVDSQGYFSTSSSNTWSPIKSEVETTSANIILKAGDSIKERFIATKNTKDLNDKTPILTIRESLKKAFGLVEKNGDLYYLDDSTKKEYPVSEKTITAIFDENTITRIKELLSQYPGKGVFDLPIERGMKMTIILPEFYDGITPSKWTGYSYGDTTGLGVAARNTLKLKEKLTIKKGFDYLISFSHRSPVRKYSFVVKLTDNKTGRSVEKVVSAASSNYEVTIPSTYIDSDDVSLSILNDNGAYITFTNFKISQLKTSEVIKTTKKIASKYNNRRLLTGNNPNSVIMSTSNTGNNQKWKFEYKSDRGAYLIRNLNNNYLLTRKKSIQNNVELVNSNQPSDNQYWILENYQDDYYRFKNYQDSNYYLYASPYSDNVSVSSYVSDIDQQFKILD